MTTKAKTWLKSKFHRPEGLSTEPGAVDAKTQSRLKKEIKKLVEYCSNKRLKLKNSPPYLQGILFDSSEHFIAIFQKSRLEVLRECPYLNLAVRKFLIHIRVTIKLFRDAKEEMEREDSDYRRQLNKLTLVFSHMLADLKAVYKDGVRDEAFVIVKLEARKFWADHFGTRVVVPWEEAFAVLKSVHKLTDLEQPALQHTMDITENNHISWFEFDVFTRLFHPWSQLFNNWYVLALNHPAYKAFITYDEVEAILHRFINKPGSYVYRLSCTRLGQWAIGFVTRSRRIVQTIPQNKSLYQALLDGTEEGLYVYPAGQDVALDLRRMINDAPQERVQVTKEEYDIYCNMDTTFELCKICNANLKSVRMEPCGHLMCDGCLEKWTATSKGDTTCPFCRKPVMSLEHIVVEPFDPLGGGATGDDDDDDDDDYDEVETDQIGEADVALLGDLYKPNGTSGPQQHAPPSSSSSSSSRMPLPPLPPTPSNPSPRERSHTQSRPEQGPPPNPDLVTRLQEMGFGREDVEKALRVARNDADMATNILLSFSS